MDEHEPIGIWEVRDSIDAAMKRLGFIRRAPLIGNRLNVWNAEGDEFMITIQRAEGGIVPDTHNPGIEGGA